jgi:hypothetical protein
VHRVVWGSYTLRSAWRRVVGQGQTGATDQTHPVDLPITSAWMTGHKPYIHMDAWSCEVRHLYLPLPLAGTVSHT